MKEANCLNQDVFFESRRVLESRPFLTGALILVCNILNETLFFCMRRQK